MGLKPKLAGRAAIVTGASRGLGAAIASRLVDDGASLLLVARQSDALEATTRALAKRAKQPDQAVLCQAADVAAAGQVQAAVDLAQQRFGAVDVLVCNAGMQGPIGPFETADPDEWRRVLDVNLFGTVNCCRAVVPLMRSRGSGKIIGLSGGGATAPRPRFSAYAASKAAVVGFLATLAAELEGSGVEVNAVAPGGLDTTMLDEMLEAGPERVGEEYFRALQQRKKGGARLETAAELVAFLASAESDGISGRLISAQWDDWRQLAERRDALADSDVYTLRRIMPADRGWQ